MLRGASRLAGRAADEIYYAGVCARAGLLRPDVPTRTAAVVRAAYRYGTLGAAPAIASERHGDRPAIVDELGTVTFAELERRSNALANAWRKRGLGAGDGVAILARNHRGFLDATFACAKVGGRAILLNTDFAGPQIRDVAAREGAEMLVCDDEYLPLLEGFSPRLGRWRAWTEAPGDDTLEALIAEGDPSPPPRPGRAGSIIVLTSGTTGSPKGAPREAPWSLSGPGALLSKVPFKKCEPTLLAAPLFHALGFAHAIMGVALGSTLVMRRRFVPELVLEDIERHRVTALIVVPVMLRRLLDSGDEALGAHDLSSLRIVFVAGSQLGGELCRRAMSALGPVVYNLYGSTEVAYATIATPEDLAVAPDCVGRSPRGAKVRIVDEAGRDVPTGTTGRIFVGNPMSFEGYTSGETKEVLDDGLMASGDVGHLDEAGRLFVDGRDDDMIVSGGENVFPQEVEELLDRHPAIREAAVIGVDDEKFGQRLAAFVVLRDGDELTVDEVKGYVRENLARYKVPREVAFLDELPRNPTGKVLKRELAV